MNASDMPIIKQLSSGFRASVDSLILAKSVHIRAGNTLLDVGSGVGTASIYAAFGIPDVQVTAIEIDQNAAELAILNYQNNGISAEVHCADLADFQFNGARFNYVITNPPFYKTTEGRVSPSSKGRANHETLPLNTWIRLCLKRVKPHGIFAIIHTVDRLGDILSAIDGSCWGIVVTPVSFQANQPPKRILITAENGSRKKLVLNNTVYAK